MKSDHHKTFSVCQDWSPVLIYNVHGGANGCLHGQRVKTCTQLGAVNMPSYLSQMKSYLHKTFSVCQNWSPELLNSVFWHTHACVHAQRINLWTQLWTVNKPSYLCQMKSDLHKTFRIYQDGLLSWLIMFIGMHMNVCMQSMWKHPCNLGH